MTNRFEEVNFKMDKLSKRITKMQSDNQMRFSDLENNPDNINVNKKSTKNKKMLPALIFHKILEEYQTMTLKKQKKFNKHNQLKQLDL